MNYHQPSTLSQIPQSIQLAIAAVDGAEFCRAKVEAYSAQTRGWIRQYCPIVVDASEGKKILYADAFAICVKNGWDFDAIREIVRIERGLGVDVQSFDAADKYEAALNSRTELVAENSAYWDSVIAEQQQALADAKLVAEQKSADELAAKKSHEAAISAQFKAKYFALIKDILSGTRCGTTLKEAVDHRFEELCQYIYSHPKNLSIDGHVVSVSTIKEYLLSL